MWQQQQHSSSSGSSRGGSLEAVPMGVAGLSALAVLMPSCIVCALINLLYSKIPVLSTCVACFILLHCPALPVLWPLLSLLLLSCWLHASSNQAKTSCMEVNRGSWSGRLRLLGSQHSWAQHISLSHGFGNAGKNLGRRAYVLALRDLLPLLPPSAGSWGGEASVEDGSRAKLASAAKGVSGRLREGCRTAPGWRSSPLPSSPAAAPAKGVSAAGGCMPSACSLAAAAAAACSALMRAGALVRSAEAAGAMATSCRRPCAWREPSRCRCCMRSSTASMDLRGWPGR